MRMLRDSLARDDTTAILERKPVHLPDGPRLPKVDTQRGRCKLAEWLGGASACPSLSSTSCIGPELNIKPQMLCYACRQKVETQSRSKTTYRPWRSMHPLTLPTRSLCSKKAAGPLPMSLRTTQSFRKGTHAPTFKTFLQQQATKPFYQQAVALVEKAEAEYTDDKNELVVQNASIDGSIQIVVLKTLRKRLL